AVVRGPAIGATMDGLIDYAANDVRLRGTFVPLFGLNNMFGQIPIVGLFLGGDKEGLVGITFEVVGPPGAPVLRVNPMSALVPASTVGARSSAGAGREGVQSRAAGAGRPSPAGEGGSGCRGRASLGLPAGARPGAGPSPPPPPVSPCRAPPPDPADH